MPTYTLDVNGRPASVDVLAPSGPLLFLLREELGLTGADAVFDAAGARLRTVPFTRERVLAALQ